MARMFMHYCVVPSGDMAGNKHNQEVTSFDIEYDQRCEVCGERLAPDLREIVAHIYEQTIEQDYVVVNERHADIALGLFEVPQHERGGCWHIETEGVLRALVLAAAVKASNALEADDE